MIAVLDRAGDPETSTDEQCLALLDSIEAERAALDALRQRTLASLHRRDASEKNWVADEVACVLRLSPCTAPGMMRDARDLVDRLPRTLEMLTDATIGLRHARALVDAVRPLDDDTTRAVETRALRRARGSTVSEFRQTVLRAVLALDPRRAEQRHADAASRRRVVCTPQDDGMSEIWALLPTDSAARIMSRLSQRAAATRGRDGRTADQRRADALADLVDPAGAGIGASINANGGGPTVHLTVALTTLLDLDDHPGELAGHGPVAASVARRIAADPTGSWRRIVTDPIGGLVSVSRAYRPPAAMREQVFARDRTCRFPGCGRTARSGDLDHIVAWGPAGRGGPTTPANLHALCSRHHHLKHEAPGWQVTRTRDGTTEWRTPNGYVVEVEPERYDQPDTEDPTADHLTADHPAVDHPAVDPPDRARTGAPPPGTGSQAGSTNAA